MDKRTGSRSRWDEHPHCLPACLGVVRTVPGANSAESPSVDPEPLSPQNSPLRALARQYAYRRVLPDCGRYRSLSSTRESRGLALVPIRPRYQHKLLLCRVRHLCSAGRAQLIARRRSDGMDRFLGLAYHHRPSGVPLLTVPHGKAAEQALEMGGVVNRGSCPSRSDHLCLLFGSADGGSRPDPKPARGRGLHQHLQSAVVHLVYCCTWSSGLIGVHATAPYHRSGASADQVVRLRCCGKGNRWRLAYLIPIWIDTPLWFERMGFALNIAFIPAVPIAIGIAILRYRLYDIDILINRTLVYGSLSAILVALYFVGIVVLQRLFVALTGEKSTLAVVASTLVIAALFTP